MQVIRLVSVWLSGGEEESETLHKKLDEKLDRYAAGEFEHAAEAISSIWDLSRKMETFPSIPQGQGGWGKRKGGQRPDDMRASLIKSIQGGSLFHRKYWAKRSRGGNICPVYFPSAISGLKLSRVAACEWNYILEGYECAELDSDRMLRGRRWSPGKERRV